MVAVTLSHPSLGTLSASLSLFLSSPNPISYSTIAGLSRECSLPCFHTPFSPIIPSLLPLLSLLLLLLCKEQRDTQKTSTRSEPSSSISTRLITRWRTTGIELLAVGDPLARLLLFFLFAKPALFLLVSSRRPTRRALLCPFSLSLLFIGY